MKSPILQIRDTSFSYDRETVLHSVSMDIQPGEFVGVIGPNGSGKSTLLKLLGGVLTTGPGKLFFREKDYKDYHRKQMARSITWIPQDHSMAFPFKVSEIVLMGRHPYLSAFTFEGDEDIEIARNAMERTQVLQFAQRGFNEISGGEKQRVVIAGAITQEPEVMILDEPTSALDIKYQIQILNILQQLNKDEQVTVVLAMHDLHLASKFCDRLVLLDQGKIFQDGRPEDVLKKENIEEVYGVKVHLIKDHDGDIMISPDTICTP
ncbi:MAG: ABC transporter ATP-binding protein [Nitrospinaceae bacterium]|jgi:iron complex transport system ATP-binding protein|nr:ABC transporter ATP-binding protein [Nitrospinaceae bacterium]MDP7058568.1 ABC transporter ATP-binding protein [Nitrospinaceae bacterium]